MKKIYKIILGGFLIILVVLSLSINSIVKKVLISSLEDKTGKTMTIKTLWINPFTGNISAKGINISEEEKTLFSLKSFKLDSSPLSIARGNLHIDEVTLIEPTIDITKNHKAEDSEVSKDTDIVSTKASTNESVPVEETASSGSIEAKVENTEAGGSFIKEVVIKNITVKNLILKSDETQLKSLNTITLEVPTFKYKDDMLNLSATLDIIDSGILDILLAANTDTGIIEGSISSESLLLTNSLSKEGEEFDIATTFNGNLDILGNYLDKEGDISGKLNFEDTKFSSSGTEVLASKNIFIDIQKASYPDLSITSSGSYDISLTSEALALALKDIPDIKAIFQGGEVKGTYNIEYPVLQIYPHMIAEEIIVDSTDKFPYKGTLKILDGKYGINTNLEDGITKLDGITNLNTIDLVDKDENSIFFRDGLIDLNLVSNGDTSEASIKTLQFSKGEASLQGTQLTNISLDISNITDKKIDSPLIFSASGSDFSKVSANLNIQMEDMENFSDLKISGDLNLDSLKLANLSKFAGDLPYSLAGTVSNNSYISYSKDSITSVGKVSGSNINIEGEGVNLSIKGFNSTLDLTLKGNEIFLNNTSLSFDNLTGDLDKNTSVNLPKADISIKKYTADEINLNKLSLISPVITVIKEDTPVKEEGSTTSDTPEADTPKNKAKTNTGGSDSKTMPNLIIKKLSITNGTYHEVTDGKKTSFTKLKLYSENFTSKKDKNFTLDASASLKGVQDAYLKGTASLTKDWEFDPMTINFKGDIGVTKVILSAFNEELSKSIPNKIEDGTLTSHGTLKLNSGVIDSNNKMVLSDLRLGEATGISSKIPLGRVIDALKDNNGDIKIEVPVKGDLTDPEFKVSAVVLEVLIANFSNILKNPEKAISNILTIGSSNKENVVYFDYLDSRPKSSDLAKLDTTIKLLSANPGAKLRVTIFTNDKVEEGIIKGKSLAGSLFGKKKEDSGDKLDELMEKRKDYILDYLTNEIDKSRIEILISDRDKSLPQAKLELIE